ncbi:hypothetical protein ACHAL6_14110 [Proteiniclasticum sp. C24MP]|uniref:hypothetical protein n=1 Tax=Proteiniclasticum sp. C24MP TaxID=3374101 RepID=UPI0037540819
MDSGTLRLIGLMLLFIVGGGLYSLVMSYFTKNSLLRFLPSIAGIILIPYLIYQMYYGNLEGFLPLAYLLFVFMILSVILGNTLTNIVLNVIRKRK